MAHDLKEREIFLLSVSIVWNLTGGFLMGPAWVKLSIAESALDLLIL
jgi:hypothetical protein